MLFNSYEFILMFLPLVLFVYYLLPRLGGGSRAGALWLVLASLFFYAYWDSRYVFLLLGSIGWNFFMGRCIEQKQADRRRFLVLGIAGNLLLLGYYKYMAFFLSNIKEVSGFPAEIPQIILPLGISFFTFTQIGYLVDAYRNKTKGYSLLSYALFVTIFPHLIAGPIIQHSAMIPQFLRRDNLKICWHNLAVGITLFSVGLFKKVMIADRIAPLTMEAFQHVDSLSFFEAWLGALGYAFQLYFDFSGYSEMAIGLGLMFNLHFPVNFNSPYQAGSLIEFWRRWHMTLGLWVKEYVYIPLGGNRHGQLCKMRNLFAAMFLIGVWHGAGWTYILWGCLHGVLLILNHQWCRLDIHLPVPVCRTLTFLTVVCLLVIFRSSQVGDAAAMLRTMFDAGSISLPAGSILADWLISRLGIGIPAADWQLQGISLKMVLLFLIIGLMTARMKNACEYLKEARLGKAELLLTIGLLVYAIVKLNNYSEFLYFQF